jgi:exodeoxyribonuclease III
MSIKSITLLSWNVNGIRAAFRKGFAQWLESAQPDVLCLQETKARPEQIEKELAQVQGYHHHFVWGTKPGYSGVALFSKAKPEKLSDSFGAKQFDDEGRIIQADFNDFLLFNVYFPNGKASPERLKYKMDFYEAFLRQMLKLLKTGKKIVICGDVNTAHQEIDLARPRENAEVSGFLPQEREWIDRLLAAGFVDTLRLHHPEAGQYSWWDLKSGARARNVGWRIDYFFVSENLKHHVKDAFIQSEVQGSDHCPVGITLS